MDAQDLLRQLRDEAERIGADAKLSQQWLRGMLCSLAPESKAGTAAFFEAIVALDRASATVRSEWMKSLALVVVIDRALEIDRERNPNRKPATEEELHVTPF